MMRAPYLQSINKRKIVGTRWLYNIKTDGKKEARLGVQGYRQKHGIYCGDTFAPACGLGSQRVLVALAAERNWVV